MNDGGPALPQIVSEYDDSAHKYVGNTYSVGGMSLRDWFAGEAISAINENFEPQDDKDWAAWVARCSYAVADAMLAERAKGADDETSA